MEVVVQLQKQLVDYTTSLFNEGILNEQFREVRSLQDESNPDFVVEVVSLFFDDSQRLLSQLSLSLEQENVDFKKLDAHVHQLKGSSSSMEKMMTGALLNGSKTLSFCWKMLQILRFVLLENTRIITAPHFNVRLQYNVVFCHGIGAQRVQNACIAFRNYCNDKDIEGCLMCLQQVRNECALVKTKLETLLKMEQQLLAAGGSIPNVVKGC